MPDIFPAPDQDDNALDARFTTPQIFTDEFGRHWDAEGREYRIATVGLDGELTFELLEPEPSRGVALLEEVTASIAAWEAPTWATRSHVDLGGVVHLRTVPPVDCLDDQDRPVAVVLELAQLDDIAVGDQGTITVVRRGAPMVALDTLRLTLDQADRLGRALAALAEMGQR